MNVGILMDHPIHLTLNLLNIREIQYFLMLNHLKIILQLSKSKYLFAKMYFIKILLAWDVHS